MNQQCVRDAAPEHLARKPVVILRPIPDVIQVRLSITSHVKFRISLDACVQTLIVVPIRRVDRNGAVAVIMQG